MSYFRGQDGSVQVGAAALAQLTNFSVNVNLEQLDKTVQGDNWRGVMGGLASWTGQAAVRFDRSVTGQAALLDQLLVASPAGTTVQLEFRINGTNRKFTGSALLTSFQVQSQMGAIVSGTFDFVGDGPLTPTWTV